MLDTNNAFVTMSFLRSEWNDEFERFRDSPEETSLAQRLQH